MRAVIETLFDGKGSIRRRLVDLAALLMLMALGYLATVILLVV